jgi:hypothetical protein
MRAARLFLLPALSVLFALPRLIMLALPVCLSSTIH